MSSYERLMALATETDTQSTPAKISELNYLLSKQACDSIKEGDHQILDDLISTLHITGNIYAETSESIIQLQNTIRATRQY